MIRGGVLFPGTDHIGNHGGDDQGGVLFPGTDDISNHGEDDQGGRTLPEKKKSR